MTMNDLDIARARRGGVQAMKHGAGVFLLTAWVVMTGWAFSATAQQSGSIVKFETPLGPQGAISFRMQTDKEYHTGPKVKPVNVDILEIPGVAKVRFSQSSTVCELQWLWARGVKADNLGVQVPGLPGPEEYFIQYTWDGPVGRFTGYVNGTALRLPETQLAPWDVPEGTEVRLATGPFKTALVSTEPRYLDEPQARAQVPEPMLGRRAELFGVYEKEPAPMEVASRLGTLLYESALDAPGSIDGWVMEGPGVTSFEDGWMTMASKQPDSTIKQGHIVHWCPRDFPERFVAEWEMQILSKEGLCIVFFAAKGLDGEDIFDPKLPKRTGIFRQYHTGAISCYHISYYANTPSSPGRITANMRKNNGFHLVANGPPGIEPGSDTVHAVRLIKDAAHVQLQVDGNVIIDFTDDGQRYGPVLGGGKIGFRQMQWTIARYRSFRVRELRTEEVGRQGERQ
jgi:hypothetical protein